MKQKVDRDRVYATYRGKDVGHAKKQGRATRHVTAHYNGRQAALPIGVQIHPQRKSPRPWHPGCTTDKTHFGEGRRLALKYDSVGALASAMRLRAAMTFIPYSYKVEVRSSAGGWDILFSSLKDAMICKCAVGFLGGRATIYAQE